MSLKAVPVGPTTPAEFVERLEEMGGDLVAFAAMYCPTENKQRWLCEVRAKIDDKELLKRWKRALDLYAEISLDYMKAEVLQKMETWPGGEDKGLAGKVAYAKLVLSDILGSRLEGAKRRAAHPYLRDLRPPNAPNGEESSTDELGDEELDELEAAMSA